jgi:hypothetical protein
MAFWDTLNGVLQGMKLFKHEKYPIDGLGRNDLTHVVLPLSFGRFMQYLTQCKNICDWPQNIYRVSNKGIFVI